MEIKEKNRLLISMVIAVCISFMIVSSILLGWSAATDFKNQKEEKPQEVVEVLIDKNKIPYFMFAFAPQDQYVWDALIYYKVKHPNIVFAQAILESGYYSSDLSKSHNNLFGLYDSRKKDFFRFNHWSQSVRGYINLVQYKYDPPDNATDEDYYKFLKDLGYAEDPEYINKLRVIVKKYKDERPLCYRVIN